MYFSRCALGLWSSGCRLVGPGDAGSAVVPLSPASPVRSEPACSGSLHGIRLRLSGARNRNSYAPSDAWNPLPVPGLQISG